MKNSEKLLERNITSVLSALEILREDIFTIEELREMAKEILDISGFGDRS